LKTETKQDIIDRYTSRLETFGPTIDALASGSAERQETRFNVLSDIGDLNGRTVLDLGCGLGDFYAFLQRRKISARYTGYDIVPGFIKHAEQKYRDADFEVRDIQENGIGGDFDYIVSSQVFNNRLSDGSNIKLVQEVLSLCYNSCNRGVALDMMVDYVDFKDDHLFYYKPEDIFSFCKSLTKRVALRNDYPLFEFSVYMYKDFIGWNNVLP
jgi:SAM-dependent methyltransferase